MRTYRSLIFNAIIKSSLAIALDSLVFRRINKIPS